LLAGFGVTEAGALLTTWLSVDDVLAAKLVSPLYAAVIEWEPAVRVEVVKTAVPPLSVTVARVVEPSLKFILPVGVPEPEVVTVAVNVTDWP
jgi:hypothetical protein